MGFVMYSSGWLTSVLPTYPQNKWGFSCLAVVDFEYYYLCTHTTHQRKLMRQVTRCRNGLAGNKAWRRGWGKQNDTWIPTPVTQHTGAPGSTSWWMPEKWIFWRPNRLMVKLISLYVYLWKKIRLPVSVWVSLAWSEWKIEKQTG